MILLDIALVVTAGFSIWLWTSFEPVVVTEG
jgi:hypothetical protein